MELYHETALNKLVGAWHQMISNNIEYAGDLVLIADTYERL